MKAGKAVAWDMASKREPRSDDDYGFMNGSDKELMSQSDGDDQANPPEVISLRKPREYSFSGVDYKLFGKFDREAMKTMFKDIENAPKKLINTLKVVKSLNLSIAQYRTLYDCILSDGYWDEAPKDLRTLYKLANELTGSLFKPVEVKVSEELTITKQTFCSVVASMLSIERLRNELVRTNKDVNEPILELLLAGKTPKQPSTITDLWDGLEWILSMNRGNPNLAKAYFKSKERGEFPLIVHFYPFFDGVCLNQGSNPVDQRQNALFVSAGELTKECRSVGNRFGYHHLSLFNQKPKGLVDVVMRSYDEELQLLADGIAIYCPATDKVYRVFGFLCGMIGDLPARQEFGGLTISSVGLFPCTFCEATQIGSAKKVIPEGVRCKMNCTEDGPATYPERPRVITYKLPGKGVESYPFVYDLPSFNWPKGLLPDVMHQVHIGEATRHFSHLFNFMQSYMFNKNVVLYWTLVSQDFKRLLGVNNVDSHHGFHDAASFKSLPASAKMNFLRLSPGILDSFMSTLKPLLKDASIWHEFVLRFDIWKKLCRISNVLCSYSLQRSELDALGAEIRVYSSSMCEAYVESRYCTVNTHMLEHWPEVIHLYGLPRSFWAYPFEYGMRWFKDLMININFVDSHLTIFARLMSCMSSDFVAEILEPGTVIPSLFTKPKNAGEPCDDSRLLKLKISEAVFNGSQAKVRRTRAGKRGSFALLGDMSSSAPEIGELIEVFQRKADGKLVLKFEIIGLLKNGHTVLFGIEERTKLVFSRSVHTFVQIYVGNEGIKTGAVGRLAAYLQTVGPPPSYFNQPAAVPVLAKESDRSNETTSQDAELSLKKRKIMVTVNLCSAENTKLSPNAALQAAPPTDIHELSSDDDNTVSNQIFLEEDCFESIEELMVLLLEADSEKWFSTDAIDYFQMLLARRCHVKWNTSLISPNSLPFDTPGRDQDSGNGSQLFQVHNIDNKHWVCSYLRDGVVYVVDSLCWQIRQPLEFTIMTQLVKIWVPFIVPAQMKKLLVKRVSAQSQINEYDCGPFALAFCYAAAAELNVGAVRFDGPTLRRQLMGCFEAKRFLDLSYIESSEPVSFHNCDISLACSCKGVDVRNDFAICQRCLKACHRPCIIMYKGTCPNCSGKR